MKHTALMFSLLLAILGFGDSDRVSIRFVPRNAPVAVTGNVVCTERVENSVISSKASGELQFLNTSNQNVIALEATAKVKCAHGEIRVVHYHHDGLFFRVHGLGSGQSISQLLPEQKSGSAITQESTPPQMDVEIRFVQFEDGSIWGDSSLMPNVRTHRKRMGLVLRHLASALNDQEFDSKLNALLADKSQDPYAYTMAYKISVLRSQSGTRAARRRVQQDLRIATERESQGKF